MLLAPPEMSMNTAIALTARSLCTWSTRSLCKFSAILTFTFSCDYHARVGGERKETHSHSCLRARGFKSSTAKGSQQRKDFHDARSRVACKSVSVPARPEPESARFRRWSVHYEHARTVQDTSPARPARRSPTAVGCGYPRRIHPSATRDRLTARAEQ